VNFAQKNIDTGGEGEKEGRNTPNDASAAKNPSNRVERINSGILGGREKIIIDGGENGDGKV